MPVELPAATAGGIVRFPILRRADGRDSSGIPPAR